jgi:hypothetical protein
MTDNAKKPGIKSSEFWVGVLTAPVVAIIVAIMSHFGFNVTEETIISLVSPAIAYIASRGFNKSAEIKAQKPE